jgi:hypothetical protein
VAREAPLEQTRDLLTVLPEAEDALRESMPRREVIRSERFALED